MKKRIKNKKFSKMILNFFFIIITIGGLAFIPNVIAVEPPNIVWEKTFGGSAHDEAYSMDLTSDNGFIITGYTRSYGAGKKDVWLIKTDSDGNELWNKTFGGEEDDVGFDVKETTDGGYIIVGRTSSFGNGEDDVWLIKTDNKGLKVWDKTFGGEDDDEGSAILQTSDGGYIIAGSLQSFADISYGAWLIKTNFKGGKIWDKIYDDAYRGNDILETKDGGYIFLCEYFLYKLDRDGNIEKWDEQYRGNSVVETSDGGYIIAGGLEWGWEVYATKYDSDLNEIWSNPFFGLENRSKQGVGNSVKQTEDGKIIMTGSTSHYLYVVNFDNDGNKIWDITFTHRNKGDDGNSIHQINSNDYIIAGSAKYVEGAYIYYDVLLVKLSYNPEESYDDKGDKTTDSNDENEDVKKDYYDSDDNSENGNEVTATDTPGFELLPVLLGIVLILFWKRKKQDKIH